MAGYLERDIASRYQMMFESQLSREGSDARLLELCAWSPSPPARSSR